MRVLLHTLASGLIAKAQGGSAIGGAAGGLTAGMLSYNDALSHLLYGKDASELSADDRMLIANIVTLAGASAGGAFDGSAGVGSGASAGRTEVENNYLSSTDKSRQTELSHKQNLTAQEQHDLDILNRKDAETSKALVGACMGGDADACKAARTDAQEKQASYKNLGYQNTKESQAGYQQIQQLLDGTSAEAKQTQELFSGMVAAYVRIGMSEDAAKSAVGYQLGAVYVVGGIAGIGGGKAADEGLTPGVKPSVPSAKPAGNTSAFDANEVRFSQNTVSNNKTERGTGMKYTYDDLVSSMKQDGWKGDPVDVVKMPDGKITSMDNTRISAAREAGTTVEANVRSYDQKLTPTEIERFSDRKRGFVPQTWGEAITCRIDKQSGGFSVKNPYGSNELPKITGRGK